MDLLIANRRGDWKKRVLRKISSRDTFVSAMYQFMDEYIYYTRDYKELKRRLKKLLWEVEKQLSNLLLTREKEFDRQKVVGLKKDFKRVLEKLEKK